MRFLLNIESDNAALADPDELGIIIINLGDKIRSGQMPENVLDANGNTVGHVEFYPGDEPCPTCNGVGQLHEVIDGPLASQDMTYDFMCVACKGTGKRGGV